MSEPASRRSRTHPLTSLNVLESSQSPHMSECHIRVPKPSQRLHMRNIIKAFTCRNVTPASHGRHKPSHGEMSHPLPIVVTKASHAEMSHPRPMVVTKAHMPKCHKVFTCQSVFFRVCM